MNFFEIFWTVGAICGIAAVCEQIWPRTRTPLLLSSGLRRDTARGLCPLGWSILE